MRMALAVGVDASRLREPQRLIGNGDLGAVDADLRATAVDVVARAVPVERQRGRAGRSECSATRRSITAATSCGSHVADTDIAPSASRPTEPRPWRATSRASIVNAPVPSSERHVTVHESRNQRRASERRSSTRVRGRRVAETIRLPSNVPFSVGRSTACRARRSCRAAGESAGSSRRLCHRIRVAREIDGGAGLEPAAFAVGEQPLDGELGGRRAARPS